MNLYVRALRAALGLSVVCILGGAGACREPTQVTLDITYSDPCAALKSVGVIATTDAVTAQERAKQRSYTTVTTTCAALSTGGSRIGTLSVTPSGSKGKASITIVAGIDRSVDTCTPDDGFQGCIVARRSFAFIEHAGPTFPIRLDRDCKSVPCTEVTTCKKGTCVDVTAECNDDECVDKVPDQPPLDGGTTDSNADGSSVDGGQTDGGTDATVEEDAATDGGTDPSCMMPNPAPKFCPAYVTPPVPCGMMNCATGSPDSGMCTNSNPGPFNATCTASRQCTPGNFCCWNSGSNVSFCNAACPPAPSRRLCRFDCDCQLGQTCVFGNGTTEPPFIKFCKP